MSKGNANRPSAAIALLQWTLGVVILIEAGLFVAPSAGHEFGATHMPQALRLLLGGAEIAAGLLFLIPKTAVRGAWLLLAVFAAAIAIHLLHGLHNAGALAVYAAAAWAVAAEKRAIAARAR